MSPGRELDALIAEKVMGRRLVRIPTAGPLSDWTQETTGPGFVELVPCYSTSIAAAWEVVEKMYGPERNHFALARGPLHWTAGWGMPQGMVCANAETAPLAICLAALKAVP